jgi:hypothetical protein
VSRQDVTEKIITTKVSKGLKWADVAKKVGQSKEWVTAACMGQMTLDKKQADVIGKIFGLSAEEKKWLMVVPYKGSLPTSVWHHVQRADPRRVWRRHHVGHRLQDGFAARARPQGRPRIDRDVGKVLALQDVLI